MKKPKAEVSFEAPKVEYETPAVEYDIPSERKLEGTFDPGACWCGKNRPGCTGNPTKVQHLFANQYRFECPFGRDRTSITAELFESARKAGLVI